jgi:hypothetical protein
LVRATLEEALLRFQTPIGLSATLLLLLSNVRVAGDSLGMPEFVMLAVDSRIGD